MFNGIIVVSVLAGAVVVVVPARHLWALWLAGKQVDALPLFWDVPVLIWGRIGKVLQFAAGLAVIIDLLDPDRLRATGREAGRRLREREAQRQLRLRPYRLSALRGKLYDSFVDVRFVVGGGAGDGAVSLNTRLPSGFGQDAPFTLEDYLDFRERVLAGLDVRTDGRLSNVQTEKIGEQVDAFFNEHLSAREKALYELGQRKLGRLAAVVGVALLGSIVSYVTVGFSLEWIFLHGVLVVGLLTLMSSAGAYLAALPGLAREVPALLAGYLATHLLDRTRPLHAFRKIAVVLFVIGFGLDLLAS
ncbi:hypothetical protein [Nonomuraea sp. NPDC050643]|uniref:hypothetical protein n=1 Tax=Nonomuraea sp. NPDC050643 TaxID=3155660 RepID=UPI0033C917EB